MRLLDIESDKVRLRVRADDSGGKRIRHHGLLAPAAKTERLALARQLLAMPQANPKAREDAQDFMRRVASIEITRCPHCQAGRWQVVELLLADRAAMAAEVPTTVPTTLATTVPASCRGPP